jgi:hypothetical protein
VKLSFRSRAVAASLLCGGAALAFGGVLMGAEPPGKPAPHLRRLTEAQYRQTIADIFGPEIKVAGRFEPDMRVEGLLAAGTGAVSVTPSGMEQYEEIARGIAGQVVDPKHRQQLVGCEPGPADPQGEACARTFFVRVGHQLYRRPLGPSEVRLAVANTLTSAKQLGDFHAGLAASLTSLLTAPEFLFQVERPSTRGATLDGNSKAARLSYFLWNTTPDAELLAAAEKGELDTPEGLARQADRLIASPRFETGARAFFQDYLHLDDLDAVSKDPLIYPAFTAPVLADAREQTLRTLVDHLIRERGDYRDVFTRRKVAINRNLGALYRVPVSASGWTTYEFGPNDPRAGLVTQIGFLAQHSHPGRTSPTLRGKAIREILMCETVPTPPANVNFAVVQDVSNPQFKTTRQRLQAHLDDEECASCHKLTDPAGLALENFDGAGQFRLRENNEVIDVSGSLGKTAAFQDAKGLGQALRENPETTACLVKSVFRYGVGRNLRVDEEVRLAGLNAAFATAGYRFPDLARAIATDPAFYAPYRSTAPLRVAAGPAERKGAF